jgi:hypothetical protein
MANDTSETSVDGQAFIGRLGYECARAAWPIIQSESFRVAT